MNDSGRMFIVLTAVTMVCGALLGGVRQLTGETIIRQQIRYVKGPAIRMVMAGAENDPVEDRRTVSVGEESFTLFEEKRDGQVTAVALETVGPGYGGALSVITGFDVNTGKCRGVAIATSKETPGIGTKVSDKSFTGQFEGMALSTKAAVSKDGGTVNGISGATISSRAVCAAVADAQKIFELISTTTQVEEP